MWWESIVHPLFAWASIPHHLQLQDLKQELKNAGLTQGGVKADLVERLWTWAQEQKQQGAQEQGQQGPPQEKQQAAPEQQPAAAPVETPAAQPAPAPSNPDPATQQQADGQAQQPAGQSKHTKIVFDDSAAAQVCRKHRKGCASVTVISPYVTKTVLMLLFKFFWSPCLD